MKLRTRDLFGTFDGDTGDLLTLGRPSTTRGAQLLGVKPARLRRLVLIGDSQVQNGIEPYGTRNPVRHANRKLGAPFDIVGESGFPGQTTRQILQRFERAVADLQPGLVVWITGTNDWTSDLTADQIAADMLEAHRRTTAIGARFVLLLLPAQIGGIYGPKRAEVTARLLQFAHENPSFELPETVTPGLDFNGEPTAIGDGLILAGVLADAVHITAKYANMIGDVLADHWRATGYPAPRRTPQYPNNGQGGGDARNMLINGLVGATASGWALQLQGSGRTAPTSTVAMGTTGLQAGRPGRLFRSQWTVGTGGSSNGDLLKAGIFRDISSGFSTYAGRTFALRFYAKAVATGGLLHQVAASAFALSWNYQTVLWDVRDGTAFETDSTVHSLQASTYEGVFELAFTVPAGTDQLHMDTCMQIKAQPSAAIDLYVGDASIRELNAST